MANQKVLIAIFVSLCLGTTNAQGGNGACFQYDKFLKHCGICFRSKVDPTTGTCGQVLPASDTCNLYSLVPIGKGIDLCVSCKPGYVTVFAKTVAQSGCVKDTAPVKDCVAPLQLRGKKLCAACKGGIPSTDKKTCVPWAQVKDKIANCEVGSVNGKGVPACAYCGVGLTYDEDSNTCKVVPGEAGCIDYGRNAKSQLYCRECDVFHGYTQVKGQKCQKFSGEVAPAAAF